MWNGAEVVPPPGPTDPDEPAAGAASDTTGRTDEPVAPEYGAPAAAETSAPEVDPADADQAGGESVEDVPAAPPAATELPDGEELPSRPSRRSLRPLAQRRRPEGGPLLRPGSAPRLRPRPSDEHPEYDEAPAASAEELFAPGDDTAAPATPAPFAAATNGASHGETNGAATNGVSTSGASTNGASTNGASTNGASTNGLHDAGTNGHGANGTNGTLPARPASGGLPRRPAAVLPNRERTPIFDEVASVWFREAEPNAPDSVDPEWSDTGRPGFDAGAPSLTAVDAGTTESGLPRRRPRAQLVPGSARPSPSPVASGAVGGPAETPRRTAEAVRGRLASYQRGVADGRSSRPGPHPDGGSAADTTNAIEEEQ